jgi:site-specific recombinase XerD
MTMVPGSTEGEVDPFSWFARTPRVVDSDRRMLAEDLFDWLATAWQLDVEHPEAKRSPLPQPLVLAEEVYTLEELMCLYGISEKVHKVVQRYRLVPMEDALEDGSSPARYRKEDLSAVIDRWEWRRVSQVLNGWWLPFFPLACQMCSRCKLHAGRPRTQQLLCKRIGYRLASLRSTVARFLQEVFRLGSVSAWWRVHSAETWVGERHTVWGILFIYLLDRHLLLLSNEELLQLTPLRLMNTEDLTRLWRFRRMPEYQQFCGALKLITSDAGTHRQVLFTLSLFVLLRYGLAGLTELSTSLSTLDLQQVCRERRLVTAHIGQGLFLPYPLSADICVGHGVLDELRFFCWRRAARAVQESGVPSWNEGSHPVKVTVVNTLERALSAPLYIDASSIVPRRPEMDGYLMNPWSLHARQVRTQNGYAFQPPVVQQQVMAYVVYCHQEQELELATLSGRVTMLMHFFHWVRAEAKREDYPHWDQTSAHEVFRAYDTSGCAGMSEHVRLAQLRFLALFFETIAELSYPVPVGYQLLSLLGRGSAWQPRAVPREEVVDRVFQDGVCQLSYDPFARLALTIQYYCGTRVTETCDLHLFCVLEDQQGHAYLLIPRGKTKKERPFPIVEVGMGPLLAYMDEIMTLRLSPDGTSRLLGRTNIRYLKNDPGRGRDWHYLFDRVPSVEASAPRRGHGRGRLGVNRVIAALHEAVVIAAKHNPLGLCQPETYHPVCQHQRKKGERCGYFVAMAGTTTCPCCGSLLSGERGTRCRHRFLEDFRCDGIGQAGEVFCPKCDTPLAQFISLTPHVFRHNSVSRAYRAGVPMLQNMQLHGHQMIPMYLRYLHLLLEDATEDVRHIFAEKRLGEVSSILREISGQESMVSVSLELYLGITLRRSLKRRTCGIWGGFWAGALAQRGVVSPLSGEGEVVIAEETYEHAVAQYWYEALGLAVSEVAFEAVAAGKWQAHIPAFLERQKIEQLVRFHLHVVQDTVGSVLGMKLIEAEIGSQRRFLRSLAEQLQPWWQYLGSIDRLMEIFVPGGGRVFQREGSTVEVVSTEGGIDEWKKDE